MKNTLGFFLCGLTLAAAPVSIQNASFESAVLPLNFGYATASQLVPGTVDFGGTLNNWTPLNLTPGNYAGAYDTAFLANPNWSFPWGTGNNGGYVQSLGTGATEEGLTQVLGDVLTANTVYTLQALVGRRLFTRPVWDYSIELWADGVQLGTASNLALNADSVGLETLTVVIGATHAQLGRNLEVRLMTNGNGTEAFFDDVTLDATATPEPGTYVLVASGLACAAFGRRNRR